MGNAGTPTNNVGQTTTDQPQGTVQPSRAAVTTLATTSSMSCIVTKIPVLLQIAMTQIFRANNSNMRTNARIMFDNGSQRSYVTNNLVRQLSLNSRCSEAMIIWTFGSHQDTMQVCDIVSLGIALKNGGRVELLFLSVPLICEPLTSQSILYANENYVHLADLDLADSGCGDDHLDIDILVGSDHYWKLVTGEVIRKDNTPTAIKTKLGWVLSGPVAGLSSQGPSTNLITAHVMTIDNYVPDDSTQDLATSSVQDHNYQVGEVHGRETS